MRLKISDTRYMQYLSAITATISLVSSGMVGSWPSPSLPKLQSDKSPIGYPISDEEASWIASVLLIAGTPVPIIFGWAMEKYGRKRSLLFSAVLTLVEWIMIIFAKSVAMLIGARCIGGVALSIVFTVSSIYIGEIAEEDIRGKLSTYLMLLRTFGTLTVLTLGPYISYKNLGFVCAVVPVVFFCSFYFMPESPYYLIKIGNIKAARRSLVVLSRKNVDDVFIDDRLELIQDTVNTEMANKSTFWEFFTKKKYRTVIFLLLGIKTLQQFSGSSALDAYLQTIIELSNSGVTPELSSIIIGCIQVPTIYISGLLVDKVGRRPLLITSSIGCAIALFAEGTYFYIQDYLNKDTSAITWLPTTALALFWIMYSIGIMPLPYVLLGELFPTNIKGIAVGLAYIYGTSSGFLVAKFFKPLSNAVGIYTVLYIFTGICLAGAVFVFVFLPETKGMNFREIQECLDRRSRDKK